MANVISFSETDLERLSGGSGKFSITWDDLYIDKAGSVGGSLGGDLLKVSLGADYVLKGGLIAKMEGDLGTAGLLYNLEGPGKNIQTNKDGTTIIDTSGWHVSSANLDVKSFDPASFKLSADLSADIELAAKGDISSHLSVHEVIPDLKTKNPLYNPAEWIEVKTKNPLYDPNEWIIVDVLFGTIKTKNPFYNPTEWLTAKTKNPLYDPNEWIIVEVQDINIEADIIPKIGFNTGKLIDIEGSKNLFKIDSSNIKPYTFDFEYGKVVAQVPHQIVASSNQLLPSADGLPDLVTFGSSPALTASVDIIKLIGAAFGIPPQAFSDKQAVKINDNINFSIDYSIAEALASANVSIGQRSTFQAQDVSVKMTASTGEIKNGHLGDKFEFATPNSGSGEITIDAEYTLNGELKTETGLLLQGSIDLKGLALGIQANLKANILGYNVDEHWDQNLIGPLFNENVQVGGTSDLIVLDSHTSKYSLSTTHDTYRITYNHTNTTNTYTDRPGDDFYDGNTGNILVSYQGPVKSYTVNYSSGSYKVGSGSDGLDTLLNVKNIAFVDGQIIYDPDSPAYQIHRLYEAVLGRDPDGLGLSSWTSQLSHGKNLSDIVPGFTNSAEFQSTYGALDDNQFVTLLYHNVLDRTPDQGGLLNWTNLLSSGGNRSEVVLGFSESVEFKNKISAENPQGIWLQDQEATTAARLYYATLDRAPDPGGLINWTHVLESGAPLEQVVSGFTHSQEFQTRYGALDDSSFVDLLYANVLDRTPDPEGKTNWVNALSHGSSREQIVLGFSESLEFQIKTQPMMDHGILLA
ncbi:DUF4214 domain-containing protein [Methylobacterium currus]|uniref:DUF4214 domain-containing protein n=1 Tax=Methylobacterium currus TaxID=2051553 RepID=UPI0013DF0867|nr:DUF4214 domain-containing protein [Methylobacterium currus]